VASKDPKIGTHGTIGKRKPVTVMIPQKLEIIIRLGSGKSRRQFMA